MLDSYIRGFEEARQFVQEHYDALPIQQNNANRFKHGNRCPQGEFWVQPPGKKGFCRAIGKKKGGMSNPQPMKAGSGKTKPNWKTNVAKGAVGATAGALIGYGIGKTIENKQSQKAHDQDMDKKWEQHRKNGIRASNRLQTIKEGQKSLNSLLN